MKELGTWRQRARGKTGKKGGKEKDGDKKERKQKDKGLNFYSFARAKCYLRSCNLFKKLLPVFSILPVVRSRSAKIL